MIEDESGWWLRPGFVAFDTETTGVDTDADRIVTAAAVRFEDGAPVEARSWLLRVDVPIPEQSTAVHGITDDMSQREGVDQRQALDEMRAALIEWNLPLVAFNATFDLAMLDRNLQRLGREQLPKGPVLCPLVVDRQFNRYVRGRNQRRLQPTLRRYGLSLADGDWHGAKADATATGRLFLAQMDAYNELRRTSPEELSDRIVTWRTQQEADFQAWRARQASRE